MSTSRGSLSLGHIAGIPFRVHWTVLIVALFLGSGLAERYGPLGALVSLVAFLGSIVAHEVGHALVARRHGIGTRSIQLWALGGMAQLDREPASPRAEAQVSLAGPLASLAIGASAVGAVFALDAFGITGAPVAILGWLGVVNVALAVFNMLPGAPLDGGRVLKAWRWHRHGDRYRAGNEAANAGKALGWSVAGIGVVAMANGHNALLLIATGAFLALSARAEQASIAVAQRLDGVRVRDLTWFGVAHATADTDADTILWQRQRLGGAGMVAVERADGTLAGVVSEEQLLAVPVDRRGDVALATLMLPWQQVTRADPDEELSLVLGRLDPSAPFVTVWRDGRLLGAISRRRLLARLTEAALPAR
jgi:Zn-dependent protease